MIQHEYDENYTYDALGRRIQKGNTAYLYIEDEEIAVIKIWWENIPDFYDPFG